MGCTVFLQGYHGVRNKLMQAILEAAASNSLNCCRSMPLSLTDWHSVILAGGVTENDAVVTDAFSAVGRPYLGEPP